MGCGQGKQDHMLNHREEDPQSLPMCVPQGHSHSSGHPPPQSGQLLVGQLKQSEMPS